MILQRRRRPSLFPFLHWLGCGTLLLLLLGSAITTSVQGLQLLQQRQRQQHPKPVIPLLVPSYTEKYIEDATTTTTTTTSTKIEGKTVGERLKFGESIVQIDHLISVDECQWLVKQCLKYSSKISRTKEIDINPGLLRIPTIAAYERAQNTKTPCSKPLPIDIDDKLQEILQRIVVYIDKELPSISSVLFHCNNDNSDDDDKDDDQNGSLSRILLDGDKLKFSSREPAINVYTKGGEFLPHKDAQSLTVLVPLSSPEDGDFQGGGTAFWSQDSRGHRVEQPTIVVKPNIGGSILLFGGCVTHSGIEVTKGARVVYVASFSRKYDENENGNGDTQQPRRRTVSSMTEQPQRDIYGDSM